MIKTYVMNTIHSSNTVANYRMILQANGSWIRMEDYEKERTQWTEQKRLLIKLLKRGDCFCEMAISNPYYKDHTAACKLLKELEKEVESV